MTDARFPERYLADRRINRLTAEEFRAWVMATLWSVSNRTDGLIDFVDIDLVPAADDEIADALTKAGLWEVHGNGWRIADFEQNQTSRHELEVLENARRRDRDKKARQRAARSAGLPTFSEVPGDSPGGSSPGTSRGRFPGEGTGQAGRTGKDQKDWPTNSEPGADEAPAVSWAVAPIGRSCPVCGKAMGEYPESMKVCESQDAAHDEYRSQHGWAA